ncbi:MAG: DsrE family protein [Saprospiraceae bacterium]|nr:DsrE family protein [Saprospiraceae bacterium]
MIICFIIFCQFYSLSGQEAQYPIVKEYGGIYKIEKATVLPDNNLDYRIVIDIVSGPDSPEQLNPALNNVARLMNLHGLGGIQPGKIEIVLAIHGKATVAVVDNDAYLKRFNVDNPNLGLIDHLKKAGVKLTVCGQSLLGSEIDPAEVNPDVEIALSMLTTVTTYQLRGFAFLRF